MNHRETVVNDRRARILDGAMQVFLAYGFQRTTMDDIARAADISRPALYLEFRNKTDIYRALAEDFVNGTLENARIALARDGLLRDRIIAAMDCALCMMAEIEQSPHGAEILDMKNSLAADIAADARTHMAAMLSAAIDAETVAGRAELPANVTPDQIAGLVVDSIDGMKLRNLGHAEQNELAAAYIALICGALAPRV